jgi:hypothetical protein
MMRKKYRNIAARKNREKKKKRQGIDDKSHASLSTDVIEVLG